MPQPLHIPSGPLYAEIDWAYENPDRVTICVACREKITLLECLHFRAGIQTFICRRCYYFNLEEVQRAKKNLRSRRVKRATPKDTDMFAIERFYVAAQVATIQTGISHHVDHIIPLIGCDEYGTHVVSGLHVAWNLQVIPAIENLRKGNRVDLKLLHHKPDRAPMDHHTRPSQESVATGGPQHQEHKGQPFAGSRSQTAMPRLVKAKHSTT